MAGLGFPEGPIDEVFVMRRVDAIKRVGIPLTGGFALVVLTSKQAEELLANLRTEAATPIGRYRLPPEFRATMRSIGARFVCTVGEAVIAVIR